MKLYYFFSFNYKKITLGKIEIVKLVDYIDNADSLIDAYVKAFSKFTNPNPKCWGLDCILKLTEE